MSFFKAETLLLIGTLTWKTEISPSTRQQSSRESPLARECSPTTDEVPAVTGGETSRSLPFRSRAIGRNMLMATRIDGVDFGCVKLTNGRSSGGLGATNCRSLKVLSASYCSSHLSLNDITRTNKK